MELRCGLCSANLAISGNGGPCSCGHSICLLCYYRYRPSACITCQIKQTAPSGSGILKHSTQNHVPHTQANPTPQPIVSPTAAPHFQTSANANPQPHVSPSVVSQPYTPPCNTPQTSTTLCSTVEHHTSQETWFRPPAPEESGHQSVTQRMEGRSDVDQMLYNVQMGNSCFGPQQGEQDGNTGQSGTTGNVSHLRQRFDPQGAMPQEGATGWKNREEDSRTPQGSSYTLRQQDTFVGHKEPQGTQSNTPSLSPPSVGQRTQPRKPHSRGTPPYPSSISTKDAYLNNTGTRETKPCPSGTTNTFPSTSDRNSSPSSSSSSPSISHTNPSRSSSRTREPSPSSLNVRSRPRSSSRKRDSSSSHPRGRISSPSPARHTDHSRSLSSPRDPSHPSSRHSSPSLSPSRSRKSSTTPSKATEPSTAPPHSNGALFSGTHSKGGNANSATSCHAATHEPQLKQALTSISTKDFTFPRTQRPITSTPTATMTRGRHLEEQEQRRTEEKGLTGELMVWQEKGDDLQHEELKRRQEAQKLIDEAMSNKIDTLQQSAMKLDVVLNLKKEMLDMKAENWARLKEECDQKQKDVVALKEKNHKHQEELAKLEQLSLSQQNQAQEQIKALTQENTELKENVATLGEAKDAQEKEASHWKAEYDKQRAATEEEMHEFKVRESNRLEKDYDRWALMMTEMQNKVAAKEGEIRQYIEKYNNLQNEFQRVQEEWVKSKGEASKLATEKEQHQEEKRKYKEEVRDLKHEISANCIEWGKERNLYTENIVMLEVKVDTLERENSSLIMKDIQSQTELAALRIDKEDERRCLIRERDSCQEEADKLKKDKETLKGNMSKLRQERNDHQLTIQALEHRISQLSEQLNVKVLPEINEFNRKKAALEEEATQLRHERDKYKEEVHQLKTRVESMPTCTRQERDMYKKEADQLKGRANSYPEKANEMSLIEKKVAELQQERDNMEREIDRLKQEENTMRSERGEFREKVDNLKREVTTLENKMTVIRRERDRYKEQVDECETQYDKIIQMVTETNKYKTREDEQSSMITLLQQDIRGYKMKIEEHKGNQTALEDKITKMKTETENHIKHLDAQIKQLQQDKGYYKERIDEYERSETTLKNQIKQMGMVIENQQKDMDSQIAQLKQERDDYVKEVEAAKWKEDALENQLKQIRDTSNHEMEVGERCKRGEDEYRQKADQLARKNYALENQLQEMTIDKDRCKWELERGVREAKQLTSKNYELENQLQEMKRDKDGSKREVERGEKEVKQLMSKNYALEDQLRQMTRDKENIERQRKGWNECRLKANQLLSRNSKLEAELNLVRYDRDRYKDEIDNYKKESDKNKQEIDRFKTRQDAEVTQHRQGTDQSQTVAERLSKQSRAGDAGPREAAQSERDLSNFLATPAHPQQSTSGAAEVVDVEMAGPEEGATLGLREEQPGTHWLEVPTQGLPNLGNTCYINSVVQCLYHLPPLRKALNISHQYLVYQHSQSGMGVATALTQLFGAMETAYDTEVRFAARELKSVLGSYDATFSGREQQEAHDLFTALVSCLHNDLSQHGSPDTFPSASSLFGGQLETSMVCLQTGESLTHTSEAFTSLSLPVVEAREWFLKDLLNKHFREQEMDWDCDRCHYTHKCSHSTRIRRCPPLLVIHFSRVAHYNSTRKVKVRFPVSGLDLQRYVAPDAPPSPQYQLVAVVCHVGSMACGHYTAYCRYGSGRRGGKWRLCNDMQVQGVKERTVLEDETAHMLFYVQQ